MKLSARTDLQTLDRRDWHLWLLAVSMIFILALGLTLFMFPTVFGLQGSAGGRPSGLPASDVLRKCFIGFCVLTLLFNGYLIESQLMIRRLRRQLLAEQKLLVEQRRQAGADLLATLPGKEHFQDQLAMEVRRAHTSGLPVSVLSVRLKAAKEISHSDAQSAAFADAVKAILGKLRREDAIYQYETGTFGIILASLPEAAAHALRERLIVALSDAAGHSERFGFDIRVTNYPADTESVSELEQLAFFLPSEQTVGGA